MNPTYDFENKVALVEVDSANHSVGRANLSVLIRTLRAVPRLTKGCPVTGLASAVRGHPSPCAGGEPDVERVSH